MATTTNHQPTGQPAPVNATLPLSCECFQIFFLFPTMTIAFGIWLLILYSPLPHHHSPQTLAPTINLVSFTATTPCNTTPATWNLTICLSNPNPKSTIYYNHFNVSLYYNYNNNSNNSNSTVFVGGDGFGKFVQTVSAGNLLFSNVSFSTHNLGKKHVVKRFLEDQKKGSVGVIIEATYFMSFNKDQGWKWEGIFSVGVNVYFEKSSGNKTGLGSALGLPKEFQLL